jgi:hypothetical protein
MSRSNLRHCAWCGDYFDAQKNWYKDRLPDLCPVCRKDRSISNRFKSLTIRVD